jgi:hypothetical protein
MHSTKVRPNGGKRILTRIKDCALQHIYRFQAGDNVLRVGTGGDENHRDESEARIAFQPSARLESVNFRHGHVEQNQVGRLAANCFQRIRAVAGFECRVAPARRGAPR